MRGSRREDTVLLAHRCGSHLIRAREQIYNLDDALEATIHHLTLYVADNPYPQLADIVATLKNFRPRVMEASLTVYTTIEQDVS